MNDSVVLTQWLNDWVDGDPEAFERVAPVVYEELRQIAGQVFRREYKEQTLQPTALVHEACERLLGVGIALNDREHFYALAARMMRRLLINHAKARLADKRGGNALRVTYEESQLGALDTADLIALDMALDKLAENDQRKAELIELKYFGGLTQPAIARVLNISESTVRREQKIATLWLRKFMGEPDKEA